MSATDKIKDMAFDETDSNIPPHNTSCGFCAQNTLNSSAIKKDSSRILKALKAITPLVDSIQDTQDEMIRSLKEVTTQSSTLSSSYSTKVMPQLEKIDDEIEKIQANLDKINTTLYKGDETELNPGLIKSVAEHKMLVLRAHTAYKIIAAVVAGAGFIGAWMFNQLQNKVGAYITILEQHINGGFK